MYENFGIVKAIDLNFHRPVYWFSIIGLDDELISWTKGPIIINRDTQIYKYNKRMENTNTQADYTYILWNKNYICVTY